MKLLNDLFSLIAGIGKKDNLEDMVEDSPFRVIIVLFGALFVFLTLIGAIVASII